MKFPDEWKKFPSKNLPNSFNETSIYDYLISSFIVEKDDNDSSDGENETNILDNNTAKPLKREKLYVNSNHVTEILDSVTSNIYRIKSKVKASYKVKNNYSVHAMINSESGKIIQGTCECKGSSLGRCAHVAVLLHILLMQCKEAEKENVACTSQLCVWNRGSIKKKAHKVDYQYKITDNKPKNNNNINNSKEKK